MADVRIQTPEPVATTRTNITAAQKQQLIDNLQNEVASRARKLRAQYALHARSLRDRLEMRINRIPHSLRKTTMEDLISRYSESLEGPVKSRPISAPVMSKAVLAAIKKSPVKEAVRPAPVTQARPIAAKNLKRTSTEMSVTDDKENANSDLDLPKKRTKTGASTAAKPSAALKTNKPTADGRVISRKVDPSQVLSPRSHNSRTLPHSPIRPAPLSPIRSLLARPVSPMKTLNVPVPSVEMPPPPTSQATTTAPKGKAKAAPASRAASKQTATSSLRGKPTSTASISVPPLPTATTAKQTRTRAASNASNASGTSAGTTIIKKAPAAEKKKGVAARVAAGLAGAGTKRAAAAGAKKTAAASTQATVAATTAANPSGRTLRSRK